MTRFRFTLASCLVFALLGPLLAFAGYITVRSTGSASGLWQDIGVLMLFGYAYLVGALQALLYGLLCSIGLLGLARIWPSFVSELHLWRRLLIAQAVGVVVVLLLQGPALVMRGEKLLTVGPGFWSQLANLWQLEAEGGTPLIGLVPFLTWYLIPTLVCVSVVGWRLVPQLRRPQDSTAVRNGQAQLETP